MNHYLPGFVKAKIVYSISTDLFVLLTDDELPFQGEKLHLGLPKALPWAEMNKAFSLSLFQIG